MAVGTPRFFINDLDIAISTDTFDTVDTIDTIKH